MEASTPARVVLVMPTDRTVPAEVMDSFAGVYGRGLTDGVVTAKIVLGDTYIDTARNLLVTHALDVPTEPTHIFWMDSDMILPADVIARLLACRKPVVGGLYHQRVPPYHPVAYSWDGERSARWIELPDGAAGLLQVDGMGLGCCLVELSVYLAMAEHFGDAWWHQVSSGRGEDLHFFDRLAQLDIPAYLDCSLRCGHVRRETVSTTHYEAWRRVHPPAQAEEYAAAD